MLNSDAKMKDLVVTTVRVSDLTMAAMCRNCQITMKGVLLVVSG